MRCSLPWTGPQILREGCLSSAEKIVVKMMPVDINEIILGLKKTLGRILRENIAFNIELADMPLTSAG